MNDKYFNILVKLANKAAKENEVPVGALIVKNDKIIAKGYNKRNKKHSIIEHAEIQVIRKASKKLKDWRLFECELYVTLKPCSMCESIINQSRIKNVYYILDKGTEKKEYYKTKYSKANNSTQEQTCQAILKAFFEKKRDK